MKNQKIKLVLAGTAKFSANVFELLINNNDFEIVALISQPNNLLDRNKNVIPTNVALLAKKYNIKLFQPTKISEIYEELKNLNFDFFITCAFGQFIPNKILELPKKAAINIHGSLLEKYRGAAPIQYSLLNNDKETGVSLIYMTNKMDAGDILFQEKFEIEENDTALEIYEKMLRLLENNLALWIKKIYENQINPKVQDETKVTLAPKINNDEAEFFTTESKEKALAKIKAFNDQPGAFIIINNKRLKVYRATTKKVSSPLNLNFIDGKLYLIEYQWEGKKKVKHEI